MSSLEDNEIKYILSQYTFKVIQIQLVCHKVDRSVWRIKTDNGIKYLKRLQCPLEKIDFMISSIAHLQSQEINIPKIHYNKVESLYCLEGDNLYILTEEIQGVKPNFGNEIDLEKSTIALAKFHLASRGIVPNYNKDLINNLGNWPKFFNEKLEFLNSLYKESKYKVNNNKSSSIELDKFLIKELPNSINNLEILQKEISSSKYSSWVNNMENTGGLCHNDYSPSNLILHPSGKLYIIDFDTLRIDLPAKDIRVLIYWTLIKNKTFSQDDLLKLLGWYQKTNPFSNQQWYIVKLYLLYPYMILFATENYRRRNWNNSEYLNKIKNGSKSDQMMLNLVSTFDFFINVNKIKK